MRFKKTLWVVQGLLGALFLFAGGMKLVLPLDAMAAPIPLPGPFMRFIGVAEVLGAFGLILPGLLRIRQDLTALAAIGLVTIMTGATVITAIGSVAQALVPFSVGLLAAFVASGRRQRGATPGRPSARARTFVWGPRYPERTRSHVRGTA